MNKWISVKERMPEHYEDVLVFGRSIDPRYNNKIAISRVTNQKFFINDDKIPDVWDWVSPWQYFFSNYKITHWMPLPEEPKDDELEELEKLRRFKRYFQSLCKNGYKIQDPYEDISDFDDWYEDAVACMEEE